MRFALEARFLTEYTEPKWHKRKKQSLSKIALRVSTFQGDLGLCFLTNRFSELVTCCKQYRYYHQENYPANEHNHDSERNPTVTLGAYLLGCQREYLLKSANSFSLCVSFSSNSVSFVTVLLRVFFLPPNLRSQEFFQLFHLVRA
jgi:hypothetical protein